MLNPLEFGSLPETCHDDQEELGPTNKPARNLDESIFIVGGSDGSTWLSANSYHLSRDVLESLSPMNLVRSYASAAKFNGQIYVLGGGDGKLWYDTGNIMTCSFNFHFVLVILNSWDIDILHFFLSFIFKCEVESYEPVRNRWSSRPPLTQRKGSLAGVSFNDKIFAIGGGNGFECLSEVEMLDLDVGRWIPTRSMLHKVKSFGLRVFSVFSECMNCLHVLNGVRINEIKIEETLNILMEKIIRNYFLYMLQVAKLNIFSIFFLGFNITNKVKGQF